MKNVVVLSLMVGLGLLGYSAFVLGNGSSTAPDNSASTLPVTPATDTAAEAQEPDFDPDIVVIGGGISNAFNKFKTAMDKEIKKRALFKTKVVKGKEDSGIIGAAFLERFI